MSITWYKLKIKKHISEYECYIRFKFDPQIQSIKIKSFIYLLDSEGNISLSDKRNKFGYDPRILGSLTIEKNFLKNKRKKNLYYDVMKYQGNFNICNLSLIDDYFRNGKALIYQYRDMIYLMDNKKYKINMGPKKFTLTLDVTNYGYIKLNLYSKLEEVERQELIFLHQNEDALCHRYLSNKSENVKNRKDTDEIEIIEDDENENFTRALPPHGKNNTNMEEEKDTKEGEENLEEENMSKSFNTYEVNSDESSYYDSIFLKEGNENNDKVSVNNSKIVLNGKDKDASNTDKTNYNILLNENAHGKNKGSKSKNNKIANNSNNVNYNTNYNININSNFNADKNNNINLFEKLKKEGNNIIISSNYENKNQSFTEYSTKKESQKSKLKKNIFDNKKYNPFNNLSSSCSKMDESFDSVSVYNNNNLLQKKSFEYLISDESEKNVLLCSSGFDSDKYNLKLLYKSLKDSDNILVFHNKCDNKRNIFCIILTLDNQKFGFFTSIGLSSDQKAVYDNKAFLFKLSKENIDCFRVKNGEIAFYTEGDYVLNLGGEQLIIRDKFLSNASFCGLKMKNYKTNFNYQINNGNKNFIIKEMEVYCISEN
jgi:hypothetical protein